MDLDLKGKVALITGASRGLGAASARLLAAEGARLALAARTERELTALAAELRGAHDAEVAPIVSDLTQPEAAEAACAQASAAFGRIDILINCAGASQGGLFWEIPDRIWQESFELKVMGTIRMMRAVIPGMIAQRYGRIVNVVGNTGLQPSPRLIPGSAANAALLAVTRGVAEDLAPYNIVANAVNPGPTRTERWVTLMNRLSQSSGRSVADIESDYTRQIPRGALAAPDEIAGLIVFMASDRAANMTGTAITADGGWNRGLG
jgi:NAD(P)-dependent dehydrogenase (short-subunit alcohol dehydrogenase family)